MSEAISISKAVKETLSDIKEEKGHLSYDSAIRDVFREADIEVKSVKEVEDDEEDDGGALDTETWTS